MLKIRRVPVPGQFSRQLTQWGLTLLIVVTLFFSVSAAYNLMVGAFTVPAGAHKRAHSTFVDRPQAPTPAQTHAG